MKMNKNIIKYGVLLSFLSFYNASLFSCGSTNNTSSQSIPDVWTGICHLGALDPKSHMGSINDFYVNTIDGDIHIKTAFDSWEKVTNLNYLPYTYQEKWELHVNYDGYFYVNEISSTALVRDNIKKGIIDNTLELKDNKYFGNNELISVNNPIILMGNYQKNAKITHYNELLIEEINTYTNKVGALEIGTYNFLTKEFKRKFKIVVDKGYNNIKINFAIPNGETLYLGGGDSNVSLYVSNDIENDDQNGLFTSNKDTLEIDDSRLILNVKAKRVSSKSTFSNISIYENENLSSFGGINYEGAPIILKDYESFENKVITKFKFPVESVSELSNNYKLTVSIIKQDYLTDQNLSKNLVKEYPLDLTAEIGDIKSTSVCKWIEKDVSSLNIKLKDGEMLGFAKNTDNVMLCIDRSKYNTTNQEFNFYLPYYRTSIFTQNVFLDVYTQQASSLTGQIEYIKEIEMNSLFKGKNISIFGDSISSYEGYSNDSSKNETLASNASHYTVSRGVPVDQTWWMRLINKTKANLLVNNSSAGDSMSGQGLNRCVQLHSKEGVNPDIICMFFGINDIWRATGSLELFKSNYVKMLDKMTDRYPNADIYVSTYIPYTWWTGTDKETIYHKTESELELYNSYVREAVQKYEDIYLVDLARDSGITYENYKNYCLDEGNRWLHPNSSGFELIANTYYEAIKESKL